jgi:hypothetical protein
LNDLGPGWWDGNKINLPPAFAWGTRIVPTQGGTAGIGDLPGPPNQLFPGFLNINRTQDVAISLTKVWGAHTSKAGFYNNHSFKAQNTGAGGGIANLSFQGYINFGNDTTNALDTGFGYANAATGVFQQYLQASKFVEGSMLYNNLEGYVQDNWKLSGRMTIDYGIRFTHQQPQHDQFLQMSNFFTSQWNTSQAQVLYQAGCLSGATLCSGNDKNARNPVTGQVSGRTYVLLGPSVFGVTVQQDPLAYQKRQQYRKASGQCYAGATLKGLAFDQPCVDKEEAKSKWPRLRVTGRPTI